MPSELHNKLTYKALTWIAARATNSGDRWATELMIDNELSWIADGVSFASPQLRYYNQIEPKPEYADFFLHVVETKVSKADFNKSFKNKNDKRKLNLIGNLNYIVTPKNLVDIKEIPEGWGLLIPSGAGMKEIIKPRFKTISEEVRHKIGYRMLWAAYSHRAINENTILKYTNSEIF